MEPLSHIAAPVTRREPRLTAYTATRDLRSLARRSHSIDSTRNACIPDPGVASMTETHRFRPREWDYPDHKIRIVTAGHLPRCAIAFA